MCIGRTIFFLSTLAVILILRSSKVESADSNNLDCDFDNGTCSWSTIRTDSTAVWTLMAGRTPSSATGPSSDHTGGGQYIYMEASGTDPNAKAKIQSPLFSTPRSGCMSLWYHMYGKNINQLNVYLQTGSVGTALWSLSGNQGNEWLMANISIQRTYNSRIVIEAVTGDGFLGDIAVDDISFSPNQTCNHVTTQTEPPEYTTEPPDYITKPITRNMYSNSKASNVTSEESTSTASSETTTEQRQTKEQTTLPKSNPTIKTNTSTVVAKGITEDSTIQSFLKKEVTGDYFVTSQIMSTAIKIETSSRQIGQHTTIDMSGKCTLLPLVCKVFYYVYYSL